MRTQFLPFHVPAIGNKEISAVSQALRSGWLTTGPVTNRFEEAFASYVGAPAALALSSGTAALHVALVAMGIGPGDSVISSAMTFCSAVHAIEHVSATPILVDVEPDTLNIDLMQVAAVLDKPRGRRIRAVMPVHLYGHPCEIDTLLELAQQYEMAVVEDAAHALPATYRGDMIGMPPKIDGLESAVLTAFSFYATKNLTTGEGGMLTGRPDLVKEARIWSLHGMSRNAWKRYGAEGSWYYEVTRPGFKYNMTDIQASIGLCQLQRLPQLHHRRLKIVRRYNEAFSTLEEVQVPPQRPGVEHAWHLYVLRMNLERLTISRDQFIEELRMRNIGSSVHFVPVHLHPYYRERYGYRPADFPIAYQQYQRIISLPLYPAMTDGDVDDVIHAVRDIVAHFRR